jgi:4-aminobutyrate aminotransferase
MTKQEILTKQKKYLWPNHLLYYTEPLPLDHGEGLYVWDVEGTKYLDFFGGILSTSVGHNHPHVAERVREQVGKLMHSSTLYPHENHVNLAEKLAQISPGRLQSSYFTNSGTEADETAVMVAQCYTGHQEVLALRHGYSGRSPLGMSLTGHASWRIGSTKIAGIKHVLNPYCYRCPLKMSYPACGVACAEDVEEVIKTTTCGQVAAMIVEPIQGVGGFITPPPAYFGIVAGIVRRYGGLLISDEVQTGFGRTGGTWFGIEHWGVEPEVMTMAKGIANGLPMGCTITTPEIAAGMVGQGLYISTFGGNPVVAAAALATLEVLETEASPEHVAEVGAYFRVGLERLREKYPLIGDVRGMGLMQGLELVADRQTKEPAPAAANHLLEQARERGLLVGKGGLYGSVIRLTPPLIATAAHVDEAVAILDHALAEVQEAI